jgi:hypothetical protein
VNAARARLVPLVLALAATPALAADPPAQHPAKAAKAVGAPADAAALAGEYHLDGVMETGSGLLLRADGTFEWFFSYGALDLQARGHWQDEGDGIALVVEDMLFPPQVPQSRFARMHLRRDGGDLVPAWPWDMDEFRKGAERGSYTRASE